MSIKVSKIVKLEQVKPESAFYKRNAHVIGRYSTKLGNTCGATNAIMEKDDFLKAVLPSIIGLSPNSPEWNSRVMLYFNNFTKVVPSSGLELEIGVIYKDEKSQKEAERELARIMDNLNKELEEIKSLPVNERLKKEHELYKQHTLNLFDYYTGLVDKATPINKEQYLIYCYCLVSSQVANREEDIKKSKNIRFYFVDKEARQAKIAQMFKITNEAEKAFFDIMGDKVKVDALLLMFGENIYSFATFEEKQMKLKTYANSSPIEFLKYFKDNKLLEKAFVEECITRGLLKRLPNSTLVTDIEGNVIGQNIDEVLMYFADAKNVAFKNELTNKLKSLKQ